MAAARGLQHKVEVDGWKLTRIKTDDGCYKAYASNDKGDRYEGKFDPGSQTHEGLRLSTSEIRAGPSMVRRQRSRNAIEQRSVGSEREDIVNTHCPKFRVHLP